MVNYTQWRSLVDGSKLPEVPDSSISRYRFEENVLDFWNNNNGTKTNGSYTTDSVEGQYSLEFGSNGYVELTNNSLDIGSNESYTISLWLKGTYSNTQGLVPSFRGSNALTIIDINNSTESIRFYTRDNNSNSISFTPSTPEIADGSWHMYTMVYDNTSGLYAYIDDNSTPIDSNTTTLSGSFTYNISNRMNNDTSVGGIWPGKIDDFKYYRKALSTSEISNLYNNGFI